MSTNSNFGILNSDGTVRACWIHYEGYPMGVGAGLLKDFKTPEAIHARLDKGNSGTLYEGFFNGVFGGEYHYLSAHAAKVFESKDEYLTTKVYDQTYYQYLYEDGKWNVYKVPSDGGKSVLMGDLKSVVEAEKRREKIGA